MKTPFITQLKTGLFTLLLAASLFSCKKTEKTEETVVTEEPTETTADVENDNAGDASFFAAVAMINREEIELGKLAQTRATSKEVKEYATMMIDGHTKSLAELTALATKKGVTLGEEFNDEEQKTLEELNSSKAKTFEKLYLSKMVAGHQDAITKFETAKENTADADVKAWIIKTIPDLQMHLDHAVMTQQKLKL